MARKEFLAPSGKIITQVTTYSFASENAKVEDEGAGIDLSDAPATVFIA